MRLLTHATLATLLLLACGDDRDNSTTIIGDYFPQPNPCPTTEGSVVGLPPGFVLDDTHYYYGMERALYRVPVAGGAPEQLAELVDDIDGPLLAADEFLFARAKGAAYRVAKTGGGAKSLGPVPGDLDALAVDGTALYYATYDDASSLAILRVEEADVSPLVVATLDPDEGIADLASDGEHVYWLTATPAKVRRVRTTGGEVEDLAYSEGLRDGDNIGRALALTDDSVVWTATYETSGPLFAVTKGGLNPRELWLEGFTTNLAVRGDTVFVAIEASSLGKLGAVDLRTETRTMVGCVDGRPSTVHANNAAAFLVTDVEARSFSHTPE